MFCSVFGHFPAKLPQYPIKRVRLEKCCWGHGSHLRVTLTWILMGLLMDLGLDLDVEFYRAWAPGVWCFGRNVIIRAVWSAG